VGRLIFLT
jgi:hypothetical protein